MHKTHTDSKELLLPEPQLVAFYFQCSADAKSRENCGYCIYM